MKNYKIGVLGLSETRWLQTGQLRFSSGEQLLYSGHTEDGAPHTEGVALMLAPEAQRALIGWEPVNSRIITAKFITKKKDIKLNIIQCYAPTNDAEEEKKDDFYQQLQTVIDRGGAKDMTILMGDFNAKIGSDNTGYEDTMGTHGLGQMNENGERFADFCALNQLVIGGSIFPHKRIHKATWRSPDHVTENQIDHICISRKFRRSWRDVRVMRGADVSSDHHLLATALRLRLKRHTNANSTWTRYNVGLLRNTDTQAAFRISLSNRFQPLQDLIEDSEMDIETQWEHSKKLWHDTCEEVLGKRKTQHKEWISADTIQKLEVRKEKKTALNTSRTRRAKAKAQEEYTAADREVKRSTRKDKRDYIDNLASQAEEAARQGNLKDLYQVTKKLMGKFQQTDKPVKDKNGHPLTTTEEQLKRWAEHFRELLNRPIPETPPDIPPAETELPINCEKPSKAEIRKAIMTLRNGKAAGPDEIPAEAIKADTETAVNMLHSLFSKIWEKEEVPAQWKEGIVIKLPKKGDLRDCSNYRGIMLLSVPGKVLNRILLERMREAVDPMLRDQQAGFRRNRSCADQIASLRIIVEQSLEWNSPLYINFIDCEKAFDSVDREALWKLLRHYGVPGKIISLIQCTYQDMSCRIAHAGQLSESFEVKTGVRQGCLLSPFLFLLVIDWIMKTTTAGRKNGIQWTLWTQLDDLDFADDLALLSHSHSQMQDKTTCLEATSAGTGLKINRKKTELMKINTTANTPVTVGGEPIREVESFVYLGSVVDGQGGTDRDVTARIGKARAAMVMLKNVWASKVVSIRTKLRIFNSNVKSVLHYGCETWRTTKTMQQKIQTFLNTCLRRIFNIRWPEKIRNEELWERAGQEPVAKQILRRKWGWIGHTLRKPASSTTRQALTWNPQGKRKRGRPRNSWRRDTEAELCKQGTNWTGVARLAQNRVRWRRVVDGLCSTWSQGPKKLVEDGSERGASFAVYHQGERLVELWGGYADPASKRPWREDTVTQAFSVTKGVSAIAVAKLVEKGQLDYKKLVKDYWPEFAQNGKANVTVEMLLSHQAGLATMGGASVSLEEYKNDWKKVEKLMAAAAPEYPPGHAVGYHAVTFGMYVDALIRRADPKHRNLTQFFQDEIAKPFDTLNDLTKLDVGVGSMMGFGSAAPLAKLYDYLGNGGKIGSKQLLPKNIVDLFSKPLTESLPSMHPNMRQPLLSQGFWISRERGVRFGHPGYGGQDARADPQNKLGIAYVTNFHSAKMITPPDNYAELEKVFYEYMYRKTISLSFRYMYRKTISLSFRYMYRKTISLSFRYMYRKTISLSFRYMYRKTISLSFRYMYRKTISLSFRYMYRKTI
nr:hypothetical protein BaRGS_031206 [Batillaria attramentaria]